MIILRKVGIVLFATLAVSLPCSAENRCKNGSLDSFKATWEIFRDETINGTPEKIADLYIFPLTLTEGTEFGEEIKISRDSFIKNYDLIFRHQLKGIDGNSALVDWIKSAPKIGKMDEFDASGCNYSGETGWYGYEFKWSDNGKWLVYSVEHKELKWLKKSMK